MASETTNSEDKFREELNWCIEYLELKLPNVGEKQGKNSTKRFKGNRFGIWYMDSFALGLFSKRNQSTMFPKAFFSLKQAFDLKTALLLIV